MANSTTHGTFTGADICLKLHTPGPGCEFLATAQRNLSNLQQLDTAFQQVTGWKLGYRENESSLKRRIASGNPDTPVSGRLVIEDMSGLLPPGVPVASRIYCEKLVEEFNKVLEQLDSSRISAHQQTLARAREYNTVMNRLLQQTPGKCQETENLQSIPALPPANPAFENQNIAITPLSIDSSLAACEWFVEPSGKARFSSIVCYNRSRNNLDVSKSGELIAARTAFLSECRHGASDIDIHHEIRNVIDRLFSGDSFVFMVNGTIHPLTGDLSFVGGEQFIANSTMPHSGLGQSRTGVATRWYLPRGQHLMFTRWPDGLELNELEDWSKSTMQKMRGLAPGSLAQLFQQRMIESIPSVPAPPKVALVISRV